ncbi:MAG: thioredoxin-dependent thiol peroxidase [Candidatus Gracilibacteria bacterium]|jgi:peroxiredoxin Q/BCP
MALTVGDSVPGDRLPSSSGKEVALTDYKGKKIVLYFYPKDDTPGCTAEACDFRDNLKNYEDLNAVIIGVSKDPLKSHDKFIEKYKLPFELLSDEEGKLLEAFGVWKEKSMYGKTFLGVERSSFLIDEEGKIVKEWRKVSVSNHVAEILEELKSM